MEKSSVVSVSWTVVWMRTSSIIGLQRASGLPWASALLIGGGQGNVHIGGIRPCVIFLPSLALLVWRIVPFGDQNIDDGTNTLILRT